MKMGLFGLFAFSMALQAQAFMTVQESNEVTPMGKHKLGAEPQIRTSNGSDPSFTGFFDAPINEEMSARVLLGSGDTDFYTGASFKWVPVPDYGNQPSVGMKVGAYFWRESSESFTTFRVDPIVSKRFETEIGDFTPYGALPVMFNSGKDYNKTGIQIAGGSEYFHKEADNMTFGLEVGVDTKDSFSYISGYVTIYLDDAHPSQLKTRTKK